MARRKRFTCRYTIPSSTDQNIIDAIPEKVLEGADEILFGTTMDLCTTVEIKFHTTPTRAVLDEIDSAFATLKTWLIQNKDPVALRMWVRATPFVPGDVERI